MRLYEKTDVDSRIHELFDKLVPATGKAGTVAGEIIRAVCRINYRYYNDGDIIGKGYGRETCNPAARYLMLNTNTAIESMIWPFLEKDYRVNISDSGYEYFLDELKLAVVEFLDRNECLMTAENKSDMFDFATEDDRDDSWDDEEEDCDDWEEEEDDWEEEGEDCYDDEGEG